MPSGGQTMPITVEDHRPHERTTPSASTTPAEPHWPATRRPIPPGTNAADPTGNRQIAVALIVSEEARNHSMSTSTPLRPPFDQELATELDAVKGRWPVLSDDTLEQIRQLNAAGVPGTEPADLTMGGAVLVEDV